MMNLVLGGCLDAMVWCEHTCLRIGDEVEDFTAFVYEIITVVLAMDPRSRVWVLVTPFNPRTNFWQTAFDTKPIMSLENKQVLSVALWPKESLTDCVK